MTRRASIIAICLLLVAIPALGVVTIAGQQHLHRGDTMGISELSWGTYHAVDVKPMYHTETGKPIYWVIAVRVLHDAKLGDVETNEAALYWIPRESLPAEYVHGIPEGTNLRLTNFGNIGWSTGK